MMRQIKVKVLLGDRNKNKGYLKFTYSSCEIALVSDLDKLKEAIIVVALREYGIDISGKIVSMTILFN